MSNAIKAGKRPSSQKTKPGPIREDDLFINPLGLDPELIKTIESKGYVHRFINAVQYRRFGHHPAHWRPVSRKQLKDWGYDTMDAHDFTEGTAPDGFIYRGNDLVLAIRTRDYNERHKSYLRQEASHKSVRNMQGIAAAQIRERSQHEGLAVHEGYHSEMDERAFHETEDSNDDEAS
jgi:hypothetical protein